MARTTVPMARTTKPAARPTSAAAERIERRVPAVRESPQGSRDAPAIGAGLKKRRAFYPPLRPSACIRFAQAGKG
ncbi:MAG: hypothetical protein LBB61_08685 [Treponema sp.]|nr:hypothetical protein [Treponema sp.]